MPRLVQVCDLLKFTRPLAAIALRAASGLAAIALLGASGLAAIALLGASGMPSAMRKAASWHALALAAVSSLVRERPEDGSMSSDADMASLGDAEGGQLARPRVGRHLEPHARAP